MFSSKPRGPRIVYVAASARELPEEVQQWLGRAEHRAASSPHIYDALALLATGIRPAVMIVNIGSVDWSEMGFFDQAARIGRETRVFVAGHDYDAAKMEAACKRGAYLFDEAAVGEALSSPPAWSRGPGMSDILAASLKPAGPWPAPAPVIRPVPPEPADFDENDGEPGFVQPATSGRAAPEEPTTPPDVVQAAPVRLVGAEPDFADGHDLEAQAPVESPGPGGETEDSDETDQPIPFPWAPSLNRPQRIPPKPQPASANPPPAAPPSAEPSPAAPAGIVPPKPLELTSEELAALMGRPTAPEKARESRA